MFKKTLLALSVAGVASLANAGNIYVSVTDSVAADLTTDLAPTGAAAEALGADSALAGGDDNCDVLATDLGVTLLDSAVTSIASAGGSDDTITFAAGGSDVTKVQMTGAGACTVFYRAETKSTTPLKDGIEYSTATNVEITPSIVVGLGGLKDEDTVTINISGAKIDVAATIAPMIVVSGDSGVKDTSVANTNIGTAADITFDVLDVAADGSQVRFTVQSATPGTVSVAPNAILDLSGVFLDSTGLSSTTAVAIEAFATNTSGTDYDPSALTTITTLTPQYTAAVTSKYDALIDVGADRQEFESSATTDVMTFSMTKNTTGLELTPATASYVIAGDFSWFANAAVDANEDGKYSSAEIGTAVAYAGGTNDAATSYAVNEDLNELTITAATTGAAVDAAHTVTFTVPGYDNGDMENPVIPVQTFTLDASVQDDKSFTTKAVEMPAGESLDAGAWELNGSVIYLPYVPFGPNTQPIIRHTNKGTRTGDLTIRYMVEGEHTEWQTLDAAGVEDSTPGVRNMLGLVTDALAGEGYDSSTSSFKVALEFVTNVPARDVFVFGGAKITTENSDRIHLGTLKDND